MPKAPHKKRATRADGRATRRRILKAARDQFAAAGYEATSLRQIAAAADVDLATLKYHFGDKPMLFGEVYRAGHEAFMGVMAPLLSGARGAATRADLRAQLRTILAAGWDFVSEHRWWARLTLFRLLESATDVRGLEEELEGIAIDLIDDALDDLGARGLLRPVDRRALLTTLITSFLSWPVLAAERPDWLGDPLPVDDDGRTRTVDYFVELACRMLVAE